ncbi:hypothetical protein EVAR_92252_1 [Eumeta japonica]|uniref:Uncharacterized protein n=1 Tax=Eumeta variegata TaxID=151549 RepID=A0A4C1TME3_EUMVA|nr:hypothetical protein EVAR_92252_1 [Eumeta japonica]
MSSLYDEVFVAAAKKKGIAMPSYKEAVYNASFVLSNSHVSLGEPVRLPQNFIPVGGYHLDLKTKPLPQRVDAGLRGTGAQAHRMTASRRRIPRQQHIDVVSFTTCWHLGPVTPHAPVDNSV